MAVVIDSGPVAATDRARDVPEGRWPDLVSARRAFCAVKLPYDCRELLRFVDEAYDMLPALGYSDVHDFVQRGLELDPKLVRWALHGLKRLKPDEPIAFDRAVVLGKRGAPRGNRNAAKEQSEFENKIGNTNFVSEGGSTRDYILARLQRDGHTELIAQVYAGEKTAHAAAQEVGYRRKKTPLEQLRHWWKKASQSERDQFMGEMDGE